MQRDSTAQANRLHVYEDKLREIIETKIQTFGRVGGSAIY